MGSEYVSIAECTGTDVHVDEMRSFSQKKKKAKKLVKTSQRGMNRMGKAGKQYSLQHYTCN